MLPITSREAMLDLSMDSTWSTIKSIESATWRLFDTLKLGALENVVMFVSKHLNRDGKMRYSFRQLSPFLNESFCRRRKNGEDTLYCEV